MCGNRRHLVPIVLSGVLVALSGTTWAQEVPSNLQIVGQVASGASDLTPVQGDEVRVVRPSSGQLEAAGTILDVKGTFFVDMSKSADFNGTQLTLFLKTNNQIRQLQFGSDNTFSFSGTFPFPSRITINPTIGDVVAIAGNGDGNGNSGSSDGDGSSSKGLQNTKFDVNGDGVFNQADIDEIKDSITSSDPNPNADVNGDGIINTRDAIASIKSLRSGTNRRGELPTVNQNQNTDGSNGGSSDVNGNSNGS